MDDRYATQRQLDYALALGIDVPAGASITYVSKLISRHLDGPPEQILVDYAEVFDIALPEPQIRTHALVAQAIRTDAGTEEYELLSHIWWVASVAADRALAPFSLALLVDARSPAVSAAAVFSSNAKAVESYNRIISTGIVPLRLWEFSTDSYDGRQSRRTLAYTTARDALDSAMRELPQPRQNSRVGGFLRKVFGRT